MEKGRGGTKLRINSVSFSPMPASLWLRSLCRLYRQAAQDKREKGLDLLDSSDFSDSSSCELEKDCPNLVQECETAYAATSVLMGLNSQSYAAPNTTTPRSPYHPGREDIAPLPPPTNGTHEATTANDVATVSETSRDHHQRGLGQCNGNTYKAVVPSVVQQPVSHTDVSDARSSVSMSNYGDVGSRAMQHEVRHHPTQQHVPPSSSSIPEYGSAEAYDSTRSRQSAHPQSISSSHANDGIRADDMRRCPSVSSNADVVSPHTSSSAHEYGSYDSTYYSERHHREQQQHPTTRQSPQLRTQQLPKDSAIAVGKCTAIYPFTGECVSCVCVCVSLARVYCFSMLLRSQCPFLSFSFNGITNKYAPESLCFSRWFRVMLFGVQRA